MDDILKEMRSDIKTILINQATVAEKQKNHCQEMLDHKIETRKEFEIIRGDVKPLRRAYWGIIFLVSVLPVALSIIKFSR